MSDSKQQVDEMTGWQAYRRLLSYVEAYWPAYLVSFFGFAIYGGTMMAFAWLVQYVPKVLDAASGKVVEVERIPVLPEFLQLSSSNAYVYFLPVMLVLIVALRGFGSYLGSYYLIFAGSNLINNLRQKLFGHLLTLPGSFFSKHASGELISTLIFNIEQVSGSTTEALKTLFREGLTVIGLLFWLFYLNWKLSLVFLVVGPIIGLVVSVTTKLFRKYSHRIQRHMGGVSHIASETFKGFEVVRTFGGKNYERKRLKDASENTLKQSLKLARVNEISTPFIQVVTFAAVAVVLWIGLSTNLHGGLDVGEFLSYLTAAGMIAKPLRQLTGINAELQRGVAASQSVFAMVDEPSEVDAGTVSVERVKGRLELKDVAFTYPNAEQAALTDISLTIEAGETVAFVGRSGSGKTTLVSLLPRFMNVSSGEITLDGVALEDYRLADLRRQIAVVNQKIVLFKDTIAHNIAYGDLAEANREQVESAARAAHAMEFIENLPQGLETPVGEDGVMLSGGQRQRLALARAILKDAPLLILDEATSALDTESERYIQQALNGVMRDRTTLVIAHRLSTIESADKIVVMDQGRIVEVGKHADLLAKQGAYAQLHQMQFSEELDADSAEQAADTE